MKYPSGTQPDGSDPKDYLVMMAKVWGVFLLICLIMKLIKG